MFYSTNILILALVPINFIEINSIYSFSREKKVIVQYNNVAIFFLIVPIKLSVPVVSILECSNYGISTHSQHSRMCQ